MMSKLFIVVSVLALSDAKAPSGVAVCRKFDLFNERRISDGFYNLRCGMVGWGFEFLISKINFLVLQFTTSKVFIITSSK